MPKGFRLDWKGDEIKDRLLNAVRQGIDETMAACVNKAKPRTPVVTGTLQGSIQFRPARIEGVRLVGRWGAFEGKHGYAIYVETGTRGRPGRNMLRSSAAEEYPKLADRVKKRYRRI